MTENERKAIDALQDMITEGQSNGDVIVARDDEEELKTAIQALEEIQQYRAIGTIEELKALKEKFENAKDDIRKLLSSEYGSSCQFCVHDENEDAMCCNIGGSGSWCCENARWKEH